jgi:segregation and condensation protein B
VGGRNGNGNGAGRLAVMTMADGAGLAADLGGDTRLAMLIESVLFVADEPVAVADLARVLDVDRKAVEAALTQLAALCASRGVRLQRSGGQVQMVTAPEAAEVIGRFLGLDSSTHLSRAALEVLSIIAYRQPVTRPEIDDLRGVCSDGPVRTLLGRSLVAPVGRRETVGHPVEYGTTFAFLEYFGLSSLDDLPATAALPGASVGLAELAPEAAEANAA